MESNADSDFDESLMAEMNLNSVISNLKKPNPYP